MWRTDELGFSPVDLASSDYQAVLSNPASPHFFRVMEAHGKRSEFLKQQKASCPLSQPNNVHKLWKLGKNPYITLWLVFTMHVLL